MITLASREKAQEKKEKGLIVPCPSCGAKNRIPPLKIHDNPVCGKCRTPLGETMYRLLGPVQVNDMTFDTFVLRSKVPVLLLAWSPLDRSIELLAPRLEKLHEYFRGRVFFALLNVLESPVLKKRFRLDITPSFLILRSGLLLGEYKGLQPVEFLKAKLEEIIKL